MKRGRTKHELLLASSHLQVPSSISPTAAQFHQLQSSNPRVTISNQLVTSSNPRSFVNIQVKRENSDIKILNFMSYIKF